MKHKSCGRGYCAADCNGRDHRRQPRRTPAFPGPGEGMVPPPFSPTPPSTFNPGGLGSVAPEMPPYVPGLHPFVPDVTPTPGGRPMIPIDRPVFNEAPPASSASSPPEWTGITPRPGTFTPSPADVSNDAPTEWTGLTARPGTFTPSPTEAPTASGPTGVVFMPDQSTATSVNEPNPVYRTSGPGMVAAAATPRPANPTTFPLGSALVHRLADLFGPPTSEIRGTACTGCGRAYTGASARSGSVQRCPYCNKVMSAAVGGISRPTSRVERTAADRLVERLTHNVQTGGVGQTPMFGAKKTPADRLVEHQIEMARFRSDPRNVQARISGIVNHPSATTGAAVSRIDPAVTAYRSGTISYDALYRSLRLRGYSDSDIAAMLRQS